jgi:phosphoribosyl 1,2-cyclic phosphodiesterase
MAYTVTFWGTRGSIPTPGAHTARYGGNTPCVAVEGSAGGGAGAAGPGGPGGPGGGARRGREGQLVILDAGTGIRALGRELVEGQNGAVRAEILLSHAHWDHIQGLPHFKPFFAPGNAVRIWGSRQGTTSLEAILRQQMDPAVFPVPLDALSAKLTVQQVEPGEFTVGPFRVQSMQLRHPGTTLGYRLTPAAGGPSMAYITDNELGPGGHYNTGPSWRKDFVGFLKGVELLIHDAMYTPEELEEHRGWGHSTFEEAVALAGDAGVQRLVLFHHEPEHGDEAIDALLAAARRQARSKGLPAEVLAAQEGMTLTL